MNNSHRAAAERLADDLQRFDGAERESLRDEAAALLRELLAAPQGEPVAWMLDGKYLAFRHEHSAIDMVKQGWTPLCTHSPKRGQDGKRKLQVQVCVPRLR